MRDFENDYEKRKDRQRGAIAVLITLLVCSGALVIIGIMAGVLENIGGKFTP